MWKGPPCIKAGVAWNVNRLLIIIICQRSEKIAILAPASASCLLLLLLLLFWCPKIKIKIKEGGIMHQSWCGLKCETPPPFNYHHLSEVREDLLAAHILIWWAKRKFVFADDGAGRLCYFSPCDPMLMVMIDGNRTANLIFLTTEQNFLIESST